MIFPGGFNAQNIQSGSGDLALCQSDGEGVLIQHRSAAHVDDVGAVFHQLELRGRDHSLGLRRQGDVEGNKVGPSQTILQVVHLFDPELLHSFPGYKAIIGHDVHIKRLGPFGDCFSDPAQADDQQVLFKYLHRASVLTAVPGICSDTAVIDSKAAAQRQDKHDGMLGHRQVIGVRNIQDTDPVGSGLFDVDVVKTHAVHSDHLQGRHGVHDLFGDGLAADHDPLDLMLVHTADQGFRLTVRRIKYVCVFLKIGHAVGLDRGMDKQNVVFHSSLSSPKTMFITDERGRINPPQNQAHGSGGQPPPERSS